MTPLAAAVLAEAEKEICREPSGKPEGGQFASCATAPPETAPSVDQLVNKVLGGVGTPAVDPASGLSPELTQMIQRTTDASIAARRAEVIAHGEPTRPHHPLDQRDNMIYRATDAVALAGSGRGAGAILERGHAKVYIEDGSGVRRIAREDMRTELIRFDGRYAGTSFTTSADQLRKILGVPEGGYMRVVAPEYGRVGYDIFVNAEIAGVPIIEKYHLNVSDGPTDKTTLALIDRETTPEWFSSASVRQRVDLQAKAIQDWINSEGHGVTFSARSSESVKNGSYTTYWSSLHTLPVTTSHIPTGGIDEPIPRAQTGPVRTLADPIDHPSEIIGRYDPANPWKIHDVESKVTPAEKGLLSGEDVNIKASGLILKEEPEWLGHVAALAGAPPGTEVQVTGTATRATINVIGDHTTPGNHALHIYEEDGNLRLKLDYLFLNEKGTGLGKQIIGSMVNAARHLGIDVVELYAGGQGPPGASSMNGYYSWPRMGFNMEMPSNLTSKMLDDGFEANDLNELFTLRGGKDWWQENGQSGDMEFDTTDGSSSMQILGRYLKEAWGHNPFGSVNERYEEVEGTLVLETTDAVIYEAEQEICREPSGKPEGGQFASCALGGSPGVGTDPEAPTGSTEPRRGFVSDIPSSTAPFGRAMLGDQPVHMTIGRGQDALVVGPNVEFTAHGRAVEISQDNLRLLTGAVPGSSFTIYRVAGSEGGEWELFVNGELRGNKFSEAGKLTIGPEGAVNYKVTSFSANMDNTWALRATDPYLDRADSQLGSARLMGYGFTPLRPPLPPEPQGTRITSPDGHVDIVPDDPADIVRGDPPSDVKHAKQIDLGDEPLFFTGRDVKPPVYIGPEEDTPAWLPEAAAMIGAPPGATVRVQRRYTGNEEYTIRANFPGGQTEITVDDTHNHIYFDGAFLDESAQGSGLGTRMMASSLMAAHSAGYDTFDLSAAGGPERGSMNGYYTWPRIGFDGHIDPDSAREAEIHFGAREGSIKSVLDILDQDGGVDWWKRNGNGFHGIFDLKPGSKSWKRLGKYLEYRFGQNPLKATRLFREWLREVEQVICREPAGTEEGGQFASCSIGGIAIPPGTPVNKAELHSNVSRMMRVFDRYLKRAQSGADTAIGDHEERQEYIAGVREVLKTASDVQIAINNMTDDERKALALYLVGSNFSRDMGNAQQGRESPISKETIEAFERALDKLPNYEGITYHGRNYKGERAEKFLAKMIVGDTIDFERSYSSSLSRAEGDKFTETILMRIKSRTGKPVGWISRHSTQREILFPKMRKIKILKVEQDPRDPRQTFITAEEVVGSANESLYFDEWFRSFGIGPLDEAGEQIVGNLCRKPAGSEDGGEFAACDDAGGGTATMEKPLQIPATTSDPNVPIKAPIMGENDTLEFYSLRNAEHRLKMSGDELRAMISVPGATDQAISIISPATESQPWEIIVTGKQLVSSTGETRDFTDRYDMHPTPNGSTTAWEITSGRNQPGDNTSIPDNETTVDQSKAFAKWINEDPANHRAASFLVSKDYYTAGDVRLNVQTGPHLVQGAGESVDLYTSDDVHALSLTKEDLRALTGTPIGGQIKVQAAVGVPDGFYITGGGESHNGGPQAAELLIQRTEIAGQPVWNLTMNRRFGMDKEGGELHTAGIMDTLKILNAENEDPIVTTIRGVVGFEPPRDPSTDVVVQPKLPYSDIADRVATGALYGPSYAEYGYTLATKQGQMGPLSPHEYDPQVIGAFTGGTVEIKSTESTGPFTANGAVVTPDFVRMVGNRNVDANDPQAGIDIPRDQFLRMVGAPDGGNVEIKNTGGSTYEINVSGNVGTTQVSDKLTMFFRNETEASLLNNNDYAIVHGTKEPFAAGWVLASDQYQAPPMPGVDRTGVPLRSIDAATTEGARELVMQGAWEQFRQQGGAVEKYEEPYVEPEEDEPDEDEDDDEGGYNDGNARDYAITSDILGTDAVFDGKDVDVKYNTTGFSDEEIAILAGAPPGSTVHVSEGYGGSGSFRLSTSGEHTDDQVVTINPSEGRMDWSRYFPSEGYRQGGLGSKIFGTIVAGARRNGFKNITIHAIGSHGEAQESDGSSGYIAWVKLGGDASLSRVEFPRERYADEARTRWHAETISDIVNQPGGMDWWYRHGGEWFGQFSLADGSYSMKRLGSKLKKKFGTNPFGSQNEFPEGQFFEFYNGWTP